MAIEIIHHSQKQMYVQAYALQFLVKFVEIVPEFTKELLLSLEGDYIVTKNLYFRKQIKRIRDNLKS